MSSQDENLVLEHLEHIRAVVDEIREDIKDISAIFDRIEQSMRRTISSDA